MGGGGFGGGGQGGDGGGGQGKADLLKSRLPRRSEKRKALDAKSAGMNAAPPSARKEPPTVSNP
jgi:hypothetical protein